MHCTKTTKKYVPEKLQCTYMYKKYGEKEIKMGVQPVGTTTKSYPALENKNKNQKYSEKKQ